MTKSEVKFWIKQDMTISYFLLIRTNVRNHTMTSPSSIILMLPQMIEILIVQERNASVQRIRCQLRSSVGVLQRQLAGCIAKPREVPLGSAMAGVASANHQHKPATSKTDINYRVRAIALI